MASYNKRKYKLMKQDRNYCSGDGTTIDSCAHPTTAFNWASTPGLSDMLEADANSGLVNNLFMAMFVLFFISLCWGFLIWLASMPICCTKSRVFGITMLSLVVVNFLIMLVALILTLVLVISGIKHISANEGWEGSAGNLLWITIGNVILLLLTIFCYSFGIAGERKKKRIDYQDKYNYREYSYGQQPTYYNQPTEPSQNRTMLQEPYEDMGNSQTHNP